MAAGTPVKSNPLSRFLGLVLVGVILTGLFWHSGAWGQNPTIHTQLITYPITGTTATALRHQMNQKGPLSNDGRRFDAYTKWYIRWRYQYGMQGGNWRDNPLQGGACRLFQIQITTDITYTMPQWQNQAPPPLQHQWQRYYQALKLHEDGHANHGKAATQAIWQRLTQFSQPSCANISTTANQAAQAIINQYAAKDREYDRQTQHGRTQGAVFP